MSLNLPDHYVKQYASNIQLLLQQKESRLSPHVMVGMHYGEKASPVDQIGAINMLPVTGQYQDKIRTDAAVSRRWVLPKSFDSTQIIDHFDKLKLLLDPQSSYVQNAVQAAQRKYDSLIIDGIFGTNYTGKEGTTPVTFPAGQQVAVNEGAASNVGLTVAKLIKAKELLMAADVDMDSDSLCCAITAKQHSNLLKEAQVISTDFNSSPVLVDGKIKSFLGINFVHTELLGIDGSSYRRVPMWAKSGVYLGKWEEMTIDVHQNKNLRGNPYEIYVMMTADASRLEEEKVIEIKCAE